MIVHLSSIESQDPSLALSFPMLWCLHRLNDFTMFLPHAPNLGHSGLFTFPSPDTHTSRVISFTQLSTPKHSDCRQQLASLPTSSLRVYIYFYTYKATLHLNFILSPDPSYFLCTNFSTTWPLSTLCLLLSFYNPLNQISAICMYMGGAIHLSISNLLAAKHQKKNVSSPLASIKCQ